MSSSVDELSKDGVVKLSDTKAAAKTTLPQKPRLTNSLDFPEVEVVEEAIARKRTVSDELSEVAVRTSHNKVIALKKKKLSRRFSFSPNQPINMQDSTSSNKIRRAPSLRKAVRALMFLPSVRRRSSHFKKTFRNLKTNLAQLFLFCGLDVESLVKSVNCESQDKGKSSKKYTAKVYSRFPPENTNDDDDVAKKLLDMIFPLGVRPKLRRKRAKANSGKRLSESSQHASYDRKNRKLHSFVITNTEGEKKYGTCLKFYEPIMMSYSAIFSDDILAATFREHLEKTSDDDSIIKIVNLIEQLYRISNTHNQDESQVERVLKQLSELSQCTDSDGMNKSCTLCAKNVESMNFQKAIDELMELLVDVGLPRLGGSARTCSPSCVYKLLLAFLYRTTYLFPALTWTTVAGYQLPLCFTSTV